MFALADLPNMDLAATGLGVVFLVEKVGAETGDTLDTEVKA